MTPGERAAAAIEAQVNAIAEEAVNREFARKPEYWARFGPIGRRRCLEDAHFHLRFLDAALVLDEPTIFVDYVGWLVELLAGYGIGKDDVFEHLECLRAVLEQRLDAENGRAAAALMAAALKEVRG